MIEHWLSVSVAHTFNPDYSESRDDEAHGSKLTWANSSQNPISKISNTRKG
jgi:hypothetical protein